MLLLQGDCIEQMKKLESESVDCIICDLPYGSTALKWDSIIDFNELWVQFHRVCRKGAIIALFSSGEFTFKLWESNPKEYKYKLVWKKNVPTGMNQAKYRPMRYYEEILIFQIGTDKSLVTYNPQMKTRVGEKKECYRYEHYNGGTEHINGDGFKVKKKYDPDWVQPSDVLEFDVVPNASGKLHPTQKPVELLEWLVKTYSNKGDVVLDCCMGSGSTGIACVNCERDFIGIEVDEGYFKVAESRIGKVDF